MFECHYTMEELVSLSETGSNQLTCAELAGYLYNARKEIERLQGLVERAKSYVIAWETVGQDSNADQWLKDAQGEAINTSKERVENQE